MPSLEDPSEPTFTTVRMKSSTCESISPAQFGFFLLWLLASTPASSARSASQVINAPGTPWPVQSYTPNMAACPNARRRRK